MLKLANIYGDHMVFQQGEPIRIWGYCDHEEMVTVEWMENGICIAQRETYPIHGRWSVDFSPFGVKRNLSIVVKNGDEEVHLTNVAVGEVWLCSGQSNIECNFEYCIGTEEYMNKFDRSDIRFMDIEPAISFEKRENAENVKWVKINKDSVVQHSVVSNIFAQCVGEQLKVPIGIVKNYRGGNSIISFLPEECFREQEKYGFLIEKLESEKQDIKSAWSMIPSAFYNAMTVPLQAFRFRGILWYQGETDSAYGRVEYYKDLLKGLISHWRKLFNNENLPVILIQLCPFGQEPFDYKRIRQIQLEVSREINNVHLVVTADLGPTGEEGESAIHPKYKTPIGERSARAALAEVYHVDIEKEWSGPIIKTACSEDDDLILVFEHYGEGLCFEGNVKGFEVDKGNNFFVDGGVTDVEILLPDKVVIKNAGKVEEVRYCYVNMVSDRTLGGSLVNTVGLPAAPFRVKVNREGVEDGLFCKNSK